jgi:hypothetical protein
MLETEHRPESRDAEKYLPHIELPDQLFQEKEQLMPEVHFPISLPGLELDGQMRFMYLNEDPKDTSHGQVELSAYKEGERAMLFRMTLFDDVMARFNGKENRLNPRDTKRVKQWFVVTRIVEENFRRNGLAEMSMRLLEQTARQLAAKNPFFKAENMYADTRLASVARLLIDKDWLKSHGLEQYQRSNGDSLGYTPYPEDADLVAPILRRGAIEAEDKGVYDFEVIRMIKPIDYQA